MRNYALIFFKTQNRDLSSLMQSSVLCEELQPKCPCWENLAHKAFSAFFLGLFSAKTELGGSWNCVALAFTPSVELKPSLCLAHTLHITRFGLPSLFSGAVVGLAMATTTSGIRHFIRPPLSAAN